LSASYQEIEVSGTLALSKCTTLTSSLRSVGQRLLINDIGFWKNVCPGRVVF
jgi:hypothetical protein